MKRNERVETIDVCPFIFRIYVDRQTVEFDTYEEVANLSDNVKDEIRHDMKIVSSLFKHKLISAATFIRIETELRSFRDSLICKYPEVQVLCKKYDDLVKTRMEKLEK